MNPDDMPIRILLAHPHSIPRQVLADVLEDEGFDVLRVGDETDLLEELTLSEDGLPIDLVVATMSLEDPTALELLGEARELGIETPFVLLNRGGNDMAREAEALDALVVDAPFDLSDVVEAVETMLETDLDKLAAA